MTNILTREQAIAGIDKAVEERGADYVYTDNFLSCAYVVGEFDEEGITEHAKALNVGEAMCIVGVVFREAGFDMSDLSNMDAPVVLNTQRPDSLEREGWLEAEHDVIEALRRAQIAQDTGDTWGEARREFRCALGLGS